MLPQAQRALKGGGISFGEKPGGVSAVQEITGKPLSALPGRGLTLAGGPAGVSAAEEITGKPLSELPSPERAPAGEGGLLKGLYDPARHMTPEQRDMLERRRITPKGEGRKMTAAGRNARDAQVQMSKARERRFKNSQLMQRYKNQLGIATFKKGAQAAIINKTQELLKNLDPMVAFDVVKNQFGGDWELGLDALSDQAFQQAYRGAGGSRRGGGQVVTKQQQQEYRSSRGEEAFNALKTSMEAKGARFE